MSSVSRMFSEGKLLINHPKNMNDMFEYHGLEVSFDTFVSGMVSGNKNLSNKMITNSALLIVGIIFCALFLALSLLFMFKK